MTHENDADVAQLPPARAPRGPTLADVIDLELQLHRDAAQPPELLHDRDVAIGNAIGARDLDDRGAVLAWLAEVTHEDSGGRRSVRWRDAVGAALGLVGFALGALGVGGWLATSGHEPVNVIYFWPAFIGSQLLLALLWWVVILPPGILDRVAILGPLQTLLRDLSGVLPRLFARLLRRLPSASADPLFSTTGALHQLDWLYGRLRFWITIRLTQVFAVAFNVGAVAAFVILPTIDDPAFGWRSRLLDDAQVEAASRIVAAPFAWAFPEALPSPEEIEATRYSSVAERHRAGEIDPPARASSSGRGERPWAAWWPFLLASLILYGLLPRIVYMVWAGVATKRALADLSFDRAELARLCDRLRRHQVETRALDPEHRGPLLGDGVARMGEGHRGFARSRALRWSGVDYDRDALLESLASRFGARPSMLETVGGIDPRDDEAALKAIESAPEGEALIVVVESWEPPVGDYIDFLMAARRAAGDGRPIVVVLFNRDRAGVLAPPEARHAAVWSQRLARLGDPWLSVDVLVREGVDVSSAAEASTDAPSSDAPSTVAGGEGA